MYRRRRLADCEHQTHRSPEWAVDSETAAWRFASPQIPRSFLARNRTAFLVPAQFEIQTLEICHHDRQMHVICTGWSRLKRRSETVHSWTRLGGMARSGLDGGVDEALRERRVDGGR